MHRFIPRRWSRRFVLTAVILMPILVVASSSGPPNSRTGAPGETTCRQCHGEFPLNTGPGSFSIVAPDSFERGEIVTVSVQLSQDQQKRWGFEVTALTAANETVGQFIITDPVHTQLDTANATDPRQYMMHTSAGTYDDTPDASPGWSFQWRAPDTTVGVVTFYGAGNAANGDDGAQGDYIYTASKFMETCPIGLPGDIDLSNSVSSADLIGLVNYVFKQGEIPLPCEGAGDANCDSKVSSSDIIYLVNYVFKNGNQPCDVCQLIPKSWPCQ